MQAGHWEECKTRRMLLASQVSEAFERIREQHRIQAQEKYRERCKKYPGAYLDACIWRKVRNLELEVVFLEQYWIREDQTYIGDALISASHALNNIKRFRPFQLPPVATAWQERPLPTLFEPSPSGRTFTRSVRKTPAWCFKKQKRSKRNYQKATKRLR